ncbi:MAG: hypothetical protein E5299_00919 [Burkholderia gladioli]|nr:MAG: hypothetical protein E5299_00919 [Burkholderia gladioli]
MASTGILITNFGSIISGDMNGLRTSEVRNPFHCVLTLDLCNNAYPLANERHPSHGEIEGIALRAAMAAWHGLVS